MPLLGQAAMLLSFDVDAEAVIEHDDWHTHEHLPERLSIPGFLRGTRWLAHQGPPRYTVLYEVERLSTLSSPAYLERLNHPSPWTTKLMPRYRCMSRGFCSVSGSFGAGLGGCGLLVRLSPREGSAAALREWLIRQLLPRLPSQQGLGSAHLLEGAATPAMTAEQALRGADAAMEWAVLVIGYREEALVALAQQELSEAALEPIGAAGVTAAVLRLDHSLDARELAFRDRSG